MKSHGNSSEPVDPDHYPMPEHAHIPGVTASAEHQLLAPIVDQADPVTSTATAYANVAWRYGLRLYNSGFYWEAHEVLERVWMNAQQNTREQQLVQGVIHLANAGLKQAMGRDPAVQRLLSLAASCFDRAFQSTDEPVMGLSAAMLPSDRTQHRWLPQSLLPDYRSP